MKRHRGSVLIFTLWLVAALAATALLFAHSSMLNYRRESNRIASLQAEHAAEAALQYVLQVLAETTAGQMPDSDSLTAEDLSIGDCRVWILGRPEETEADEPVFGLLDEAAKLNLNSADADMLEALEGMTEELAGAIVDWRDSDAELSVSGAESETYLGCQPPYVAKDAPFETVGELGLLNGASPELLAGRDLNRNGYLEEWEKALEEHAAGRFSDRPAIGFRETFTVHSQEPNVTADGEALTNINGAGPRALNVLIELLGEARAGTVAQTAGLGTARFGSVLEFCIRGGLTASEAEQVMGRLTTVDDSVIRGRVNVNTASPVVLACLPGVGEDLAAQLVAYRQNNPDSLATPMWLVEAIGQEATLAAAPYVTTKSYQIAADIVAVAADGRVFRRVCAVVDTTSGSPVVIARHDLTSFGWPLGAEWRDQLLKDRLENQP